MNSARQSILLVEDDADDLALLQRTLKQARFTAPIEVVPNGETALAFLQGKEPCADRERYPLPALIFLDLKLPGMYGFEVLTAIRHESRWNRIPVVVLTGSKYTIDIYRAYELGADSYLVKPVGLEALNGLIKSLNLQSLLSPAPAPSDPTASRF